MGIIRTRIQRRMARTLSEPVRWVLTLRTRSVCMTCTAMFWNGALIGTACTLPASRRWMIPLVPALARRVFCGAVPGTSPLLTAVPRTAVSAIPRTVVPSSVSVWCVSFERVPELSFFSNSVSLSSDLSLPHRPCGGGIMTGRYRRTSVSTNNPEAQRRRRMACMWYGPTVPI